MTVHSLAISLVICLVALLAACSRQPENWAGSSETPTLEEEFAEGHCECFHDYFASIGIEVNTLLAHYPDFEKVRTGTPRTEVEAQFPELKLELAKIAEAKAEIGQTPCYRALVARAEATPPNGEKVLSLQRSRCRLQLFLDLY